MHAIRSRPLREVHPIHPPKGPPHNRREPVRPALPAESGLPDTVRQESLGPINSAPTAVGSGWDGVGVGLAGFAPSSNPPDTNGRVGATQFVQWNNTSFAVFDKTTGALLYGPAAGNTLFRRSAEFAPRIMTATQSSHDILAGRWILSQFVVDGPAGSARTNAWRFRSPPTPRVLTIFTISSPTPRTSLIIPTSASGRTATI